DARRQQPLSGLRAGGDEPREFEQTIRSLADNHLITLSGRAGDPDRKVDVCHESIIKGWPTFRAWLTERREAEQVRRRLAAKVEEWVRNAREGGLLDRVSLAEAERWLSSPDATDLGVDADLLALVQASRQTIESAERERARTVALELSHRQFQGIVE